MTSQRLDDLMRNGVRIIGEQNYWETTLTDPYIHRPSMPLNNAKNKCIGFQTVIEGKKSLIDSIQYK